MANRGERGIEAFVGYEVNPGVPKKLLAIARPRRNLPAELQRPFRAENDSGTPVGDSNLARLFSEGMEEEAVANFDSPTVKSVANLNPLPK